MKMHKIVAGERFGMLIVRADDGTRDAKKNRMLLCLCDCGGTTHAKAKYLNCGKVRSCGCLRARGNHLRHGDSIRGKIAPEYRTWMAMIARCENKRNNRYQNYGARGIEVCQRWRGSYEAFLSDMGRKPSSEHSIDRIDNDGNYEPGNCRWATPAQQAANTSRKAA